ncbi:MAG: CoA transferase, partial [Oricola sp.]|nr:CoA transferase [Oricola sp.]
IGRLEPKFYAELLERLGLAGDPDFMAQYDRSKWPALKARLAAVIKTKTRDEWTALLEGTDVCFAPVLAPSEASAHPHMKARGALREIGGVLQAAAAPRFDGAAPQDPGPIPAPGQHTEEILAELGVDDRLIAEWRGTGAR